MNIRKFLLCVVALGAMTSASLLQAQDEKKGRSGMSAEQQIERIEQAVGSLSDEQKTKIKDIVAKNREEMQALPKEERKGKMQDMAKSQREKIRTVLTDEQKKKYDEMPMGKGKKKDQ